MTLRVQLTLRFVGEDLVTTRFSETPEKHFGLNPSLTRLAQTAFDR
jgi:hypothetical protein